MKRKVYLEGEMAEKFGSELTVNVDNVRDSLRLLEANFPEFRSYLISCAEKDVGFIIDVADSNIDNEEDLILPLREGDITITPVPAGSKSGGAKILAAVAIIAFLVFNPLALAGGGNLLTATGLTTLQTTAVLSAASLAINLALTGIQQLMAPDPAVDQEAPQSYLFNGSQQNAIEGDPVPILYGELRVPGRPISFGAVSNSRVYTSSVSSGGGAGEGNAVPNYNGTPSDVENASSYEQDISAYLNLVDQSNNIKLIPAIGTDIES
jgi:predicted phage tail protein